MNILFYAILFIIGSVVGCLWSVKAREIPKVLNLKKSDNRNNTKQELISELAYIFIGGVSATILANILDLHIDEFDIIKLIIYVFAMLYISTLVLTAGIDRNYFKIDKKILAFGMVSSILYMLYLCMVDLASLYLNAIYLAIYFLLLFIDSFLLRRFAKDSYIVNLFMLVTIILVFTDLKTLTYTLVMSLIAVGIYVLILNIQKKKNGHKKIKINEIPVGFFIAASNIIVLFLVRVFENYII